MAGVNDRYLPHLNGKALMNALKTNNVMNNPLQRRGLKLHSCRNLLILGALLWRVMAHEKTE
jgi:hypothetical protein